MFQALAAEGINMKMITTGDIKISVLVEEDAPDEEHRVDDAVRRADQEGAPGIAEGGSRAARRCGRFTRRSGWPNRARAPACRRTRSGNGFKPRPNPLVVAGREGPRGRHRPARRAWRTCSSAAST